MLVCVGYIYIGLALKAHPTLHHMNWVLTLFFTGYCCLHKKRISQECLWGYATVGRKTRGQKILKSVFVLITPSFESLYGFMIIVQEKKNQNNERLLCKATVELTWTRIVTWVTLYFGRETYNTLPNFSKNFVTLSMVALAGKFSTYTVHASSSIFSRLVIAFFRRISSTESLRTI